MQAPGTILSFIGGRLYVYAYVHQWRCASVGKQKWIAFFLSILVLSFTLNWLKRKGKMEEDYFKHIFPKKKLEKRTKQKQKLNAQVKETR